MVETPSSGAPGIQRARGPVLCRPGLGIRGSLRAVPACVCSVPVCSRLLGSSALPRNRPKCHLSAFPCPVGQQALAPHPRMCVRGHSMGLFIILGSFDSMRTRGCSAGICRCLSLPVGCRLCARGPLPPSPFSHTLRSEEQQPAPGRSHPMKPLTTMWPGE